ncbi:hypothetical protein Pla123a_06540 [Posidoniimonas polymericola]|uniref:Cytochrome c-552/4 domain-containing protein n=2 Tax=Posidoniimonas polymericola TaxID=2528002 RepID=A0A5C5ZFP1_9BACT|nr:hypothetical protein Pla123a_06540 [Posidoniimonas polymericola]
MIGAACPHALDLFDREGLAPPPVASQQTDAMPSPQREPIRVAMRATEQPVRSLRVAQNTDRGDWLVPPGDWFVPEDKEANGGAAAEPAADKAPAESSAGAPVEAPNDGPAVTIAPPAAQPPATAPLAATPPDPDALEADAIELAPPATAEPRNNQPPAAPGPTKIAESPAPAGGSAEPPAAPSVDSRLWTPDAIEGPDLGFGGEPASPSDAGPPVVPKPTPPTKPEPPTRPAPSIERSEQPLPPQQPSAPPVAPAKPGRSLFDAPRSALPAPIKQPIEQPAKQPEGMPQRSQRAVDPLPQPSKPVEVVPKPAQPQPTQQRAAAPRRVMSSDGGGMQPREQRPITPEPVFAAPAPRLPAAASASGAAHGAPHSVPSAAGGAATDSKLSSIGAHRELFAKNCYPSAQECGECHKQLYDEWRVSSHAYAFVSPMFQKFEQKITDLSQGTVGYFCYRCHSPVGTALGENRATPLWEMPKVAREGVTCIACHRINERYTKANGERRIVPGDIYAPVYGGIGGDGVAAAIAKADHYKVKTSPDQKGAGQPIHLEGRYFDQLSKAEFCTSCHQVAVHPGIKLEVVWEQYRQSPACKKGVTCQDCHMGLKPGEASGYEIGPIAEVGGKAVNKQRKHANHMFYGPNYSISHPGVFPHNKDAERWTMQQWLKFNWRAGWGTDDFEDALDDGKLVAHFPPEWQEADDRFDAREVIDDNLKALEKKNAKRREIMTDHMHVAGPYFKHEPARGAPIRLYYDVTNLNEGHNVLTASLGAQPQLWANVVLIGPNGDRLWESGYTDSDGDLCDIHSRDVQLNRAPFDHQLFNLQTMFLITGATGTDREMPLPVNVDIDQLPFLRPGANPITTMNHPPFIRMESRSIAPLGTKRVHYKIPKELIQAPGKYRLSFRLRNRIEPIWFMRFCEATDDMVRMMNEGILDMHHRSVEFYVR